MGAGCCKAHETTDQIDHNITGTSGGRNCQDHTETCSDMKICTIPYARSWYPEKITAVKFDCGYWIYSYFGTDQSSVWKKQWDGAHKKKNTYQPSRSGGWGKTDEPLLKDLISHLVKYGCVRNVGHWKCLSGDDVTHPDYQYPAGLKDGNGKELRDLAKYLPNRLPRTENNNRNKFIYHYGPYEKFFGEVKLTFKALQLYKGKKGIANNFGTQKSQYGLDVLMLVEHVPQT